MLILKCEQVYTLWNCPGLLPLLHTPRLVLEKMRNGADLMTPGLLGPPFPPAAVKGALVAVSDDEHPSVPQVVGTCELDIASLATVRGSNGHAVRGMHWLGDELWNWSPTAAPGLPPPESIQGWLTDEDPTIVVNVQDLHLKGHTEERGRTGDLDGNTAPVPCSPKREPSLGKPSQNWTSDGDVPCVMWRLKLTW